MAKYTVTHTCGCTVEHQIYGTNVNNERFKRRDWLATQPCKDCKIAAQNAAAAEKNKHLPELTGSPKQIAWAETLRAKVDADLSVLVKRMDTIEATDNVPDSELAKVKVAKEIMASILAKTEAKFFIDNRYITYDGNWLFKQVTAKLGA